MVYKFVFKKTDRRQIIKIKIRKLISNKIKSYFNFLKNVHFLER